MLLGEQPAGYNIVTPYPAGGWYYAPAALYLIDNITLQTGRPSAALPDHLSPHAMADPSQTTTSAEAEGPPQAPSVDRRLKLRPLHLALVALLFLVITFAASGFFGVTRGAAEAQSEALALLVDYPTRFRYKQVEPMRVYVRNTSPRSIDTVRVRFDDRYIDPFSNVSFTPSASEVWQVVLTDLKPGQKRRVQVHLQAEQYGRHAGTVTATSGPDSARAEVSTFVFP